MLIPAFIVIALGARLVSVAISLRNERRLKAAGAVEHGRGATKALTLLHALFYLACLGEALSRGTALDGLSLAGILVWVFSMAALALVISQLGGLWTVKLIIAREHRLVKSRLFKLVRHPNYFLNVLPELTGLALAAHAWRTLAVLGPLYVVVLARRIRDEEALMRGRFADY